MGGTKIFFENFFDRRLTKNFRKRFYEKYYINPSNTQILVTPKSFVKIFSERASQKIFEKDFGSRFQKYCIYSFLHSYGGYW